MMYRDEFEAEIDYLHQLCEELGRSEPELAPMLGRNADPSVSRLVEGLAFAFGRLRQRLDDDLPEMIHPVIESLCPEALQPVPSATVMALEPVAAKVLSRTVVPAGSTFASRPVDGITCMFQSTVDVEVTPWSLAKVEATGTTVRLELEVFPGVDLRAAMPERLRLFLAHPLAAALEARHLLLEHATGVVVRLPDAAGTVTLGAPVAALAHRTDGTSALARAFFDLRDYFVFPHSFMFVEIADFDHVLSLGTLERFIVEIALDCPIPKGIAFDTTTVQLHAVPARNVFRPNEVRIPLKGDKLRCDVHVDEPGAQVHSIREVTLVNHALQKRPVEPWARFFGIRADDGQNPRYEIRRSPSVIGSALSVSLAFTPGSHPRFDDVIAAEVSVLATNGDRASALGLDDVSHRTSASPSIVSFRNVTPVTRSLAPPLDDDYLWQLFRFLKSSFASLADSLGEVLALANLAARARWPNAKPDASNFVPLLAVERQRTRSTVRDELRAGAVLRLTLEPSRFEGPGDIHLFGSLLVPLFAATLHPRHWVEIVLVDPSGNVLAEYGRARGNRLGL